MKSIDLYIDADLVREAQELSNPLLKVPNDAAQGRNDTRKWVERLVVAGSTVELDEATGWYVFRVRFKVSPLSPTDENHGKPITLWARYSPKPNDDKEAFMSKLTINRLDALLRAVGFDFKDQRVNYGALFSSDDLLTQEVMATIVDRPDNKDATIRRQEPTNFLPVS